jgi:hypothetical protein
LSRVAFAGIRSSVNSSASAVVVATTVSMRYGTSAASVRTTQVDVSSTVSLAATVNVTPIFCWMNA